MSENNENMKASIFFMCSLHVNPVVEINSISSIKVKGIFMPALGCTGIVADGNTYPVKFPIAGLEAHNENQMEELRKSLHERIDKSFDEYKKNWAAREDKIRSARKLAAVKNKEETDAPRNEPKEDDVGEKRDS